MKRKYKILMVDDEKPVREAIGNKLIREGFIFLEAADGREGLQIALQEHPDVILLDLLMPVMDGQTMLHKLREDAWGRKAPVLILTNLSDANLYKESTAEGVCGYLIKTNWKLDDVVKKISKILNHA